MDIVNVAIVFLMIYFLILVLVEFKDLALTNEWA